MDTLWGTQKEALFKQTNLWNDKGDFTPEMPQTACA